MYLSPFWYFNSTMVRLIEFITLQFIHQGSSFQFHDGTIDSFNVKLVTAQNQIFQFHDGTIDSRQALQTF